MTNTTAKPERRMAHARFATKYVPFLAGILAAPERSVPPPFPQKTPFEGIQIEPCEAGGVWLVASTQCVIAWVRDPDGETTEPLVLDVCDRFVSACKPPTLPQPFDVNGEGWDLALPDWATPNEVEIITDVSDLPSSRFVLSPPPHGMSLTMIIPKGLPPGVSEDDGPLLARFSLRMHGETQTIRRKPVPWRDIAAKAGDEPVSAMMLDPSLLAPLCNLESAMRMRFNGQRGAVLIDWPNEPNYHAAVMPCGISKEEQEAEKAAAEPVNA